MEDNGRSLWTRGFLQRTPSPLEEVEWDDDDEPLGFFEENDLQAELDLSRREDLAVIKPTPFSLAKLRAEHMARSKGGTGESRRPMGSSIRTALDTDEPAPAAPKPAWTAPKKKFGPNSGWTNSRGELMPSGGPSKTGKRGHTEEIIARPYKTTRKMVPTKLAKAAATKGKGKKKDDGKVEFHRLPPSPADTSTFPILAGLERQRSLPTKASATGKKRKAKPCVPPKQALQQSKLDLDTLVSGLRGPAKKTATMERKSSSSSEAEDLGSALAAYQFKNPRPLRPAHRLMPPRKAFSPATKKSKSTSRRLESPPVPLDAAIDRNGSSSSPRATSPGDVGAQAFFSSLGPVDASRESPVDARSGTASVVALDSDMGQHAPGSPPGEPVSLPAARQPATQQSTAHSLTPLEPTAHHRSTPSSDALDDVQAIPWPSARPLTNNTTSAPSQRGHPPRGIVAPAGHAPKEVSTANLSALEAIVEDGQYGDDFAREHPVMSQEGVGYQSISASSGPVPARDGASSHSSRTHDRDSRRPTAPLPRRRPKSIEEHALHPHNVFEPWRQSEFGGLHLPQNTEYEEGSNRGPYGSEQRRNDLRAPGGSEYYSGSRASYGSDYPEGDRRAHHGHDHRASHHQDDARGGHNAAPTYAPDPYSSETRRSHALLHANGNSARSSPPSQRSQSSMSSHPFLHPRQKTSAVAAYTHDRAHPGTRSAYDRVSEQGQWSTFPERPRRLTLPPPKPTAPPRQSGTFHLPVKLFDQGRAPRTPAAVSEPSLFSGPVKVSTWAPTPLHSYPPPQPSAGPSRAYVPSHVRALERAAQTTPAPQRHYQHAYPTPQSAPRSIARTSQASTDDDSWADNWKLPSNGTYHPSRF